MSDLPQPQQVDITVYWDRVEMSFWSVHNHADKKGNPNYPPLSGAYRAGKYAAAIKIDKQSDVPAALKTLWRCALLTERILLTGEYTGENDCLFCTFVPGAAVCQIPMSGKTI